MGFFSKLKEGLQKTRDAMMHKMQTILNSFTKIDEELFEQLEETMIMGDMGVETSVEICERLRKLVKERGVKNPAEIMGLIEEIVSDMMGEETELDLSTKPSVIMVIGVNGAGKTTTIGKLCYQFKNDGKKVLVAAADTFRAAAIEQLEVWTERAGVSIVKHAEGSDPASVVYDAVTAAIARDCDIVIVDTAGRLQNKKNLMDELAKMNRILQQRAEGCAIETLLVLDATTGQNAVSQARLFSEVANITGIVLTKLDGTAKGGIVVSIKNELGIPVKLVGVGEKIEDLQRFNNADFVRALFDRPEEEAVSEENQQEKPETEEISKKRNTLFSFGKKEESKLEIPAAEPEPEIPAAEPESQIPAAEPEPQIPAAEPKLEIPVEES
ncbi:MAG: signal recognition particle-docking protein FtsY, partial [Oscillospiraceae bacterium]|nr:signal recognition particle-docking protein FtsY [Oscillospiraceae bacterium]